MTKKLLSKRLADGDVPWSKWYAQKRWNSSNIAARRAHRAVAKALRERRLERGRRAICGSLRVEAHHPRYDEPLNVVWLCRRHHSAIHAELRRAA